MDRLNETERAGYFWLRRQYDDADIEFQVRASPDFLTTDGKGWEIKLIRQNVITFSSYQLAMAQTHPKCTVLAFERGSAEPAISFALRELGPGMMTRYIGKYRITVFHDRLIAGSHAIYPVHKKP